MVFKIGMGCLCAVMAGCTGEKITDKETRSVNSQKSSKGKKIKKIKSQNADPRNANPRNAKSRNAKSRNAKSRNANPRNAAPNPPKGAVAWMHVKNKEVLIPKWGVKIKLYPKLMAKFKNKTPYVNKVSRWIKYRRETINDNFSAPSGSSQLNFQLSKIQRPPPKNLAEASSFWQGKKEGVDRKEGNLFVGLRSQMVRGPGSCGGGRCKHMTIPELRAFVLLPLGKDSYAQCRVFWANGTFSGLSLKTDVFFQKFFKVCLSLQTMKKSP